MRSANLLFYSLCSIFCILIFSNCASLTTHNNTLALVDGEPVTKDDLGYSLQISHRREDLSATKQFDISQYIQKLIDDRLIIQEARRMGLENSPEIQEKIREFVLRESVVKLYNEEIVGKVSVTEKDIADYYKENYESLTLNIIEADNETAAGEILQKVKSGEEIEKFLPEDEAGPEKQKVKDLVVKRKALKPALKEAVSVLKPGEISGVIKEHDKYYIIKLLDRQAAPDAELESAAGAIKSALKDRQIKELSDKYLIQLREKEAVKIDRELLDSINPDEGDKTREEWSKDMRPLVTANNMTLTVGDFVAMLPAKPTKSKEVILNSWLDFKLVDLDALSRHYEVNSELKDSVQRYKNVLLKAAFTRKVINPGIRITDKDAEDYYMGHQDEYLKPAKYKIQQITLNSREEAQEALNSLAGGANFSWLAKTKSKDSFASAGGVVDWKTKELLPDPAKEIIDDLTQGDISPILQNNSEYMIFRLMEKSEREVESFNDVKPRAHRAAYEDKFHEIYNSYIEKLRKDARIELNEEAVRAFEKPFKK
ncbi:MAG: peptidyl-prolyl cis-trans isomerase [Nitrospirae bacterium]|nr:peptidyl-prolyl cis-trans isomerase [Nitrospirota bacterium]